MVPWVLKAMRTVLLLSMLEMSVGPDQNQGWERMRFVTSPNQEERWHGDFVCQVGHRLKSVCCLPPQDAVLHHGPLLYIQQRQR